MRDGPRHTGGARCGCPWLSFNRLVKRRNIVQEAWSGIDVQLRRRHNLIPNLVSVVEGYSIHERGVLEQVARLRAETDRARNLRAKQDGENALSQTLKSIIAVAEAYPELKADRRYHDLQRQLVEVEDQIQMARRYYNGAVREYNICVESFPGNLVARLFGFGREEFFQVVSATERAVPMVEAPGA